MYLAIIADVTTITIKRRDEAKWMNTYFKRMIL